MANDLYVLQIYFLLIAEIFHNITIQLLFMSKLLWINLVKKCLVRFRLGISVKAFWKQWWICSLINTAMTSQLFILFTHVHIHISLCVCMCIGALNMGECACVWRPKVDMSIFFHHSSPYLLRQIFFWTCSTCTELIKFPSLSCDSPVSVRDPLWQVYHLAA